MLTARGDKSIGRARLRWMLAFTRRVWCLGVEREGLVLDTRFIPSVQQAARDGACVYVLVSGVFEIHGGARFQGPAAFVLSETHIDGAGGARPFTYRAAGARYAAIELHLPMTDVTPRPGPMPTPITLDAATWQDARAIALERDLARVPSLIAQLARQGIVSADVAASTSDAPPRAFVLLWDALRPMIERLYLTPTLQELVETTGVSLRQIDRYVVEFVSAFSLVGDSWRPTTRYLRLKLAILLSSAEQASVAEVARIVGYGSPDAMARAYRDAGLPPPSVVQDQLRNSE